MWFSYSDESTYEQDGGESADEFVEIIKQLSFKDGTELAFIYNTGGGYYSCHESNDDDDEDDYYNSDDDNRVYFNGDQCLDDYEYYILLETADGDIKAWSSDYFKASDENISIGDILIKMLNFFQELYNMLIIGNTVI